MTYMLAKQTPFKTNSPNSSVTLHHHYVYGGFARSHVAAPTVDPRRDLEVQVPNISNVYPDTMTS